MKKFELYNQEGKQMIRRNIPPRFVGEVTFGPLSDIENVQFLDDQPSAMDAARAMREAGEYLLCQSKKPPTPREIIGEKVKDLRTRRGLTIRELAERCDVNYANICKIEKGAYNVSIDILSKICKALGAELDIKEV